MSELELSWLPQLPDWVARIKELEQQAHIPWRELVSLANSRIDFLRTERLDRLLQKCFANAPPPELTTKPVRLGLLGSSTLAHLHAGIRVAALRRGIWLSIYETDYGQYLQELLDPSSALYRFQPTVALIALDARHLTSGLAGALGQAEAEQILTETLGKLRQCWRIVRDNLKASVIQQTVLPVLPSLVGNNEHRLPESPSRAVTQLNSAIRTMAEVERVHLLALDERAGLDGIRVWHDPLLWHRAKQEVSPTCGPVYGDLLARILAAMQGRSAKCLVLDLDNTIWGGVIGDDGLDGIVIGQGSGLGEAFSAVQGYALALARRGIILAVCSKNDESIARAPFDKHPEMLLNSKHISYFAANWDDKATNLRRIANELNISLESLVFVDDNPFERNLVRQELPEVAVPEIPDDEPASVPQLLADAGYFEAISVTDDDRARTDLYLGDLERASHQATSTDLASYLRSLEMELIWRRFDRLGLARITQLINKTNQFNLRTRRYSEDEVTAVMLDSRMFGLQIRLVDRFGDNGVIAVVIGKLDVHGDCVIDSWLMSCRVLGRDVEKATLNVVAKEAKKLGAKRLVGEYLPTGKNGMVARHYEKLGFTMVEARDDGGTVSAIALDDFNEQETFMHVREGN